MTANVFRFQPGDLVTWLYSPPGGYGYVFPVDGVVVGFGRGRIKIEVSKANGEKVTRFVREESLRERRQQK